MKYLKSTHKDLRILFERSITVKHIAEPLISFDAEYPAMQVRKFLEAKDYDVTGVRQYGLVSGYANKIDLVNGKLGDYLLSFKSENVLDEKTSLLRVFKVLNQSQRAFILMFGVVGGIVTRGDLQKIPVRMWLFSLVSLIEMQLLRLIREYYPDESWKLIISENRLKNAKEIFNDRCKRNEEIDLVDCLQFCDKLKIFFANEKLSNIVGSTSKTRAKRILIDIKNLRNELAHSQDIITGNWPKLLELIDDAENILKQLEEVDIAANIM
jgi:hypothetical protein